MNVLACGDHFSIKLKPLSSAQRGYSRADNYHANSQNRAKIEFNKDLPVCPVICKFNEEPIKNEVANIRTTFTPLYIFSK